MRAAITPTHDVTHRAGIFYAQFLGHCSRLAVVSSSVNNQDISTAPNLPHCHAFPTQIELRGTWHPPCFLRAMRRPTKCLVDKETIVRDVAIMLESDVSDEAIKHLVSSAYAWFWSQDCAVKGHRGKYKGCEHWSRAAKDLWLKKGGIPKGEIIHEHVVPRAQLVKELIELRKSAEHASLDDRLEQVRTIFQTRCIACIVLKAENSILPTHSALCERVQSTWGRYIGVPGLVVGSISNGRPETWKALELW